VFSVCEQESLEHTQEFRDQILRVLDDESVCVTQIQIKEKEEIELVFFFFFFFRYHLSWPGIRWI
jgi:hypothetical protein